MTCLSSPTPRFHEFDGGRYFGTAHVVITQDYNQSWVNVGVYRSMLVDKNRLALHMQSGHDGAIMFREYQARKQPMPMVLALGVDPALWFTGFTHLPWGVSEYDYTGGILGEALPVIKGPYTGLPIPANAEIAVEGELLPDEEVPEGPFGEWHGYYANLGLEKVPEPVMQVKSIMFRHDPILTAVQLAKPPHEYTLARCLTQSGAVWDALDGCAVPGITGVWCHEAGAGSLLTIISLKTAYAGHSRQVGVIASQIPEVYGRYTIVVDEDVDPSNLDEVMWVVSTRVDPERSIEILRYCRSANSDPAVSIEEKRKSRILYNSRCIIDACRPYDWKQESYPIARMSPELKARLLKKWSKPLKGYLK
ncbi:MAG: UbiD family decarboxylase [Chloroflexota bacterium]